MPSIWNQLGGNHFQLPEFHTEIASPVVPSTTDSIVKGRVAIEVKLNSIPFSIILEDHRIILLFTVFALVAIGIITVIIYAFGRSRRVATFTAVEPIDEDDIPLSQLVQNSAMPM